MTGGKMMASFLLLVSDLNTAGSPNPIHGKTSDFTLLNLPICPADFKGVPL
jgi:hypothetical protein